MIAVHGLASLLGLYVMISLLYFAYAGVMNLKRAMEEKTIPMWVVYAMGIWVIAALLLDVAVNWFIMTVIFFELPNEWTVTTRLTRHGYETGWRSRLAHIICKALDPLDPSGKHCG